jgi:uncharacterized protein YkwD
VCTHPNAKAAHIQGWKNSTWHRRFSKDENLTMSGNKLGNLESHHLQQQQ